MSCSPSPWRPLAAGVLALGTVVSCQVGKLFQDGGADPPAARLEFAAPPNATAGDPLSPAVRVSAVDSTGNVDTTFHGTVNLTLGEHPEGAVLRGTRTLDAVRGVASFADLSINRAGTGYTLVATATGVRGATSPAFDVAPAAAARLAFTGQPHSATVDSVLKQPVQVTASDTLGNVATSFTGNVTLALGPVSNGGTLGGTTTVAAASGVATFADLTVNRAGTGYRLTASAGQLGGATSDPFDIIAGPPTTGDLTVNATTTGDNAPGSYSVTVDGALQRTIAANGAGTTYTALPAGDHTVALTDVPANCTVSGGGASKTVTVPAGGAATAAFTISCSALTGSLTVRTTTTGANLDPDGYTFAVDGDTPQPIGINATIPLTGIPTGSRTVALAGVAANCTVTGGASQTVSVPPGGTATAAFTISCTQLTGSVTVTTSTSGGTPDPDGYTVAVTGATSQHIEPNATVTFQDLATGSHTVTLSGIASNCSVSGGTSRPVTVTTGPPVTVTFTIDCPTVPPPTGSLTVSTSTSGGTPDPDGYTVAVTGAASQHIDPNSSVTFTDLATGSHTVTLSGIASNCSASGGTSQSVTVTAGQTATSSFSVDCPTPPPPTGSLTVSTSTSGGTPDPDGYTVTVNGTGGASQHINTNGSATFDNLAAGSHTVTLSGLASNCSASGTSKTVTVPQGGSTSTSFSVDCPTPPPPTGSLDVSVSTSGGTPDPDGYTITVNGTGGASQHIDPNSSVTFDNLAAGSHTVTLSGLASNCSVSGGTSKSVTVPQGGSTSTSFAVDCPTPPPPTGSLDVSVSTSGGTPDPDGYTVTVNGTGAGSQHIDPNSSVTFDNLAAGSHTVTLSGLASNCSASATSKTVTVPQGGSTSTSFSVNCPTPPPPNQRPVVSAGPDQNPLVGALFNLSGASFSDPDHNGPWTVVIDWGDGSSSRFSASEGAINASHTYLTILPATYTLTITVTDPGGLSGSDSKTVKVTIL